MNINEEQFDGFHVAVCPKCTNKRKEQIPFKKGDKLVICPVCGTKIDEKDIIKTINKPINRQIWYSVETDSFFDY